MTVFAWLCAAASVALGATYLFAAGAPRLYPVINIAALVAGVIAASRLRHMPLRDRRIVAASTLTIGLLMTATALYGVEIEGASRWIRVAGISLQPSLILLPLAIVLFAGSRGWWSSVGLVIASIGLALQPDRAMAGTLAAALAALWLHRREGPVTVALAAAILAFAATLRSADVVPPVPFVERVVQSAFAFNPLAGLAIVAGLVTMLTPAVLGLRSSHKDAFVVFGATWLSVIAFAMIGNYPTPLVGYGSSAILGYCLSTAGLEDPAPQTRE